MSADIINPARGVYSAPWTRGRGIAVTGELAAYLALVVVFLWFGLLKFTGYEASAIAPLLMNSPLVGWTVGAFGVGGAAMLIGVFEIATAVLLVGRFMKPVLGVIGGAMACVTFLVTLSFMLTTPGVAQPGVEHSLALSAMPGQFLLKDLVLLAVSFWAAAAAYEDFRHGR